MTALRITGMGIAAAGAVDVPGFASVLRSGRSAIRDVPGLPLRRAALLPDAAFLLPDGLSMPRGATRAARSAARVAHEAWTTAGLADRVDPERVALVVAGHNMALALTAETLRAQADRIAFTPPRYAVQVWDSHVAGVVSKILGIRGPGLLAGGHFASGITALAHAALLLRTGEAEVAVCVAPCAELSDLELHAFANLGATSSPGDETAPYQPFGEGQSGFVLGQGAACVILESAPRAGALAILASAKILLAGHAGPEPDEAAEIRVMRAALAASGLAPDAIGYVSAHATGTPAGDAAEAAALRTVFTNAAPRVNATKALTGHTLCAAGLVGVIATIVQLRGGFLHADPHLSVSPPGLRMAGACGDTLRTNAALCNAFGFDGFHGSAVLTTGSGT